MVEKSNENEVIDADHSIDITGLICPMTFVRTKLRLEKIAPGEVLEVRLKGDEPLVDVNFITQVSRGDDGSLVRNIFSPMG